jgi:hypothetical protein
MDRSAREQAALIAAFRQGLELAGLAVIRGPAGTRLAAVGSDGVGPFAPGEICNVRFWCRHAGDAERIVAAAKSKLPRQARDVDPRVVSSSASSYVSCFAPAADQVLIAAAARLCVVLYSDEEIVGEAVASISRVEAELENLQGSGALKSVNRSYRIYRQDSSARGEKIVPYAIWFGKYKENLVRELAIALRYC